jgi:hypothetical protein
MASSTPQERNDLHTSVSGRIPRSGTRIYILKILGSDISWHVRFDEGRAVWRIRLVLRSGSSEYDL